tara:strand:- start:20770 stop:22032 length:1263 start_codon:yes stop_codon:yes gene_type:complete
MYIDPKILEEMQKRQQQQQQNRVAVQEPRRINSFFARGGGFTPDQAQQEALKRGFFETQADANTYEQQQRNARNVGLGNMLYSLSDAFAGRNIGAEAQQRQANTLAMQKQQEEINARARFEQTLAQMVSTGQISKQEAQLAIATGKLPNKPNAQENFDWANSDPTPNDGVITQADQIEMQRRMEFVKPKTPVTNIDLGDKAEWKYKEIDYTEGRKELSEDKKILQTDTALVPKFRQAQIILNQENFDTGIMQKATLGPRQLYSEITGIDDPNVTNQLVFEAIASYATPRMRPPGSGASSDFEQMMFARATVGLGKNREANRIIVATAIQQAERDRKLLQLKEEFFEEQKTTLGFDAYMSNNPDLMPLVYQNIDAQAVNENNESIIGSMADTNAIKEGEAYIDTSDPDNPVLRIFSKKDFE